MKQTTLFENNVKRLETKFTTKSYNSNQNSVTNTEPQLKKVAYNASSNDSDVIPGFDTTKPDWIYPINYPIRSYQLQIVQECLVKNTLVCLPTGLGKTFIASVVLYNFYRWYPRGKSIFIAPTRPLVTQQMAACLDTVPIDSVDVTELTGSIAQAARIELWRDKRVFFLTAQVLVNDLAAGICPGTDIVFLALDEAHKATKNHSYCQLVRLLTGDGHSNRLFRVIALSATPGNELDTIQEVIQNLLISHIELRTDECPDIRPFSHERFVEEVVVPLDSALIDFRNKLLDIASPIIERLKMAGAIAPHYTAKMVTKYGLLKLKEEYRARPGGTKSNTAFEDFAQAISVYYALELLQQHGLRPTFLFFSNAICNSQTMPQIIHLMMNQQFMDFYDELKRKFEQDSNEIVGHPKLMKLKSIVYDHFSGKNTEDQQKSRVIIFSQIRDSVDEIIRLLKQMEPLIRPIAFMGRSKNVSQREQMEAMHLFSTGEYNVLVSTCIGEEGLDIGEVDLIICFDSQKSPIRLIQRSGRTGRKKEGRVVMLLTEGKEVRNYHTSLSKKSRIHSAIFEGYKHLVFYPNNPRMIPLGIEPTVSFQTVTIPRRLRKSPTGKSKSLKQKPITDCLPSLSQLPTLNVDPDVSEPMRFLKQETSSGTTFCQRYKPNRYKIALYQTQPTFKISHSDITKNLISTLKLKEMHGRGKTNILFHLYSSRIVDIDEPLSQPEELSQHSMNSFSFSLSSDDECESDTNYELVEGLRKVENFVFLPSFKWPIRPLMPDKQFDDILSKVQQNKPSFVDGLNRQIQKTLIQSNINNISLILPDTPLKRNFHENKDNNNSNPNLCTSTPILSTNKSHTMKKLLNSFKIPTNSLNKNQSLLNCFKIPFQGSLIKSHQSKDNHQLSECSSNSHRNLSTTTRVLSFELSTDLFETDESFQFSESEVKNDNQGKMEEALLDYPSSQKIKESLIKSFEFQNTKHDLNFDIGVLDNLEKENSFKSDEDLFSDMELYSPVSGEENLSENDENIDREEIRHKPDNFNDDRTEKEEILSTDQTVKIKEDVEEELYFSDLSDSFLFADNVQEPNRSISPSFESNEPSFISKEQIKKKEILSIDQSEKSVKKENIEEELFFSDISDSFLISEDIQESHRSRSPSFESRSADHIDESNESESFHEKENNSPKRKKSKNPVRQFFLSQAVVDGNKEDNSEEDDDEDFEFDDEMEPSFIDDADKSAVVNTQMQQIYLDSLKSPKNRQAWPSGSATARPLDPIVKSKFIFSQELSSDDDYIMDSFVIPDDYVTPKKKRPKLLKKSSGTPAKKFKRLRSINDSII